MSGIYRVRATIAYGFGGSPGLYTAYFAAATGGGLLAEAQTVSARVRGAWDVFKSVLSTDTIVTTQPLVDLLDDNTGDLIGSFVTAPGAAVTGTNASTFTGPSSVMLGLRLTTAQILNGRRVIGHSFLGPLAASQTPFPQVQAGLAAAGNAFGVAVITAAPLTETLPLVVWHRPTGPSGAKTGGSSYRVISAAAQAKFFTLKSRRD